MRTCATNHRFGRLALVICTGALACGCADLARVASLRPDAPDPGSPVAAEVVEAGRRSFPTPRFRDIPPTPQDVPPASAYGAAAAQTLESGAALTAWLAANPPFLTGDAEAFAADQRATIPAREREGALPDPAGTEAFARRLRELAAPPPPPQ